MKPVLKKWIKVNRLYIFGGIAGGIGGYFYWLLVGCTNGSCLISSRPLNSSIYGAFLGALLLGVFKKDEKKIEEEPKK